MPELQHMLITTRTLPEANTNKKSYDHLYSIVLGVNGPFKFQVTFLHSDLS